MALGRDPAVFGVWPPDCVPLGPAGLQRGSRWQSSVHRLAAAGGFVDLPGPPAGWLRTYATMIFITAANSPATSGPWTATLQPSGLIMQPLAAAATGSMAGNNTIGPGESIRVTNAHATVATDLNVSYIDTPNLEGKVTLGRILIGLVPVTIIPTPPVGRIRRLWVGGGTLIQSGGATARGVFALYNRDTITHSVNLKQGSSFVGRNNTTFTAGSFSTILSDASKSLEASDAPVTAETIVAVSTTPPVLYVAYETLDVGGA